jgi:hypothetical protein
MKSDTLLTTADRVELLVNGLNSGIDHRPVVKLFTPDGAATWLLTECDPDEPDRLFGLCDLGLGCPELGYVSLAEVTEVRGRLGLPVERDLHFVADKSLSAYADEARANGRIIA